MLSVIYYLITALIIQYISINVINCYSFEENQTEDNIKRKHEFVLKTKGIEEIYIDDNLKMAN